MPVKKSKTSADSVSKNEQYPSYPARGFEQPSGVRGAKSDSSERDRGRMGMDRPRDSHSPNNYWDLAPNADGQAKRGFRNMNLDQRGPRRGYLNPNDMWDDKFGARNADGRRVRSDKGTANLHSKRRGRRLINSNKIFDMGRQELDGAVSQRKLGRGISKS